jgi:hypothetical protein
MLILSSGSFKARWAVGPSGRVVATCPASSPDRSRLNR